MSPPSYSPSHYNHYYDKNNAGSWEEEQRKMHNNPHNSSSVSSHPHHTHTHNLSQYPSQYPNHQSNLVHNTHYSNHLPPSSTYHGNGFNGYNGNYAQENIQPNSYPNHGWNPLPPSYGHSHSSWNPPPPSKHYSDHMNSHGFVHEESNRGDGGKRGERRERRVGSINDQIILKERGVEYEESRSSRKRFNSKGDSYSSSTDPGGLTEAEKREFTALIQDLWCNQRFAQEFKKYNVGEYMRIRDLLEKLKDQEEEDKDNRARRTTRQ